MTWNFDNTYTRLPGHFYSRMNPVAVRQPNLVLLNEALLQELGLSAYAEAAPKQSPEKSEPDAPNETPEKSEPEQPAESAKEAKQSKLAELFSGNVLPDGAEPIALAYAGHQFGHFTFLGDGRAHLLGEHITPDARRVDIQLKGSGVTPYGRRGDGRAALGPMLREYFISEAMHALGIPTTRSLAVVTTGEVVYRESELRGAIVTRVAASHLRVGMFEYFAARKDEEALRRLADYAIARHYPAIRLSAQAPEGADGANGERDSLHPYLQFLQQVMDRHIHLICEWMRVGFIHGVMNTDNMAISGETIDYGPCAFMDHYDPKTVFSSIDQAGRYAYGNQPYIAQWNLTCLANTLIPLLAGEDGDTKQSVAMADAIIQSFPAQFENQWLAMMGRKLGFASANAVSGQAVNSSADTHVNNEKQAHNQTNKQAHKQLIMDLLKWMQRVGADYTNTFRELSDFGDLQGELCKDLDWQQWHKRWRHCLHEHAVSSSGSSASASTTAATSAAASTSTSTTAATTDEQSLALMRASNPVYIPRNHRVEMALMAAEQEEEIAKIKELPQVKELLDVIASPYTERPAAAVADYKKPPKPEEVVPATFCGT